MSYEGISVQTWATLNSSYYRTVLQNFRVFLVNRHLLISGFTRCIHFLEMLFINRFKRVKISPQGEIHIWTICEDEYILYNKSKYG